MVAAIVVGLVMALLVVLLVTRKPASDTGGVSAVVGKQAPALGGKVLVGQPFDIGASDRYVLVNFFATWCTPCVQEHPELRKFSADMARTGQARVVSVVYGDKASAVRSFFVRRGGDWTVLDADNGRTALEWGVAKVPESFLVSPTGYVLQRIQGGVRAADLERLIDEYDRLDAESAGGGS
jgi:cytochrome c biogenesis protein CcmG/thiol:disulfide interchange protein DsbE